MRVLVELYTPKAAWLALASDERSRYLAGVREAVAGLGAAGVSCFALGRVHHGVDRAAPHTDFGVWTARDDGALRLFLDGLGASGWYDHFDHVNGAGPNEGLEHHLSEHQALTA